MADFLVGVKCPYCGFSQKALIEVESNKQSYRQIINCDQEEGGCDEEFVVFFHVSITHDSRCIQGIGGYL